MNHNQETPDKCYAMAQAGPPTFPSDIDMRHHVTVMRVPTSPLTLTEWLREPDNEAWLLQKLDAAEMARKFCEQRHQLIVRLLQHNIDGLNDRIQQLENDKVQQVNLMDYYQKQRDEARTQFARLLQELNALLRKKMIANLRRALLRVVTKVAGKPL